MITLFVGDNDVALSTQAIAYDARAILVDESNWKAILQTKSDQNITIYTSLADLPKIDSKTFALWQIICVAHTIFYCPPSVWSDDTGTFAWSGQKCLTEYYLYMARLSGRSVTGLNLDHYRVSPYLKLVQKRLDDRRSVWISGCSISHGAGVAEQERYGTIVGTTLNLPTYHLTRVGTSLEWAADQLLRSDIRSGDIVIWGLTEETRGPLARDGKILILDHSREFIAQRLDETRYYKAITSVNQVVNITRKLGCQLILLPLICSEKLRMDLLHCPELLNLPYQTNYVDLGSDGLHPGPKQHKIYADFCLGLVT